MQWFPIFLRLEQRSVLVVGGGVVAERKLRLLQRTKAAIDVVAASLTPEVQVWADGGELTHLATSFDPAQLVGRSIVVVATDDDALNRLVAEQAAKLGIPVNVVDNPELCTFVFPSILDRSPLLIAISSGGASPVLARNLRARLETFIPAGYGRLAEWAGGYREQVKARVPAALRRRFWEDVLEGAIGEQVLAGGTEPEAAFSSALARAEQADVGVGEVYLVGGGPGDPDLLTFKALRLMQKADVVLYDRLVAPEILDLVRRDAERINVGKQRDQHTLPQDQINDKLVELAKQGKRVLRLKGGDPFIFGRGGEEIDRLAEHGIPFQVVPGITAASGCAAYAGIPLTHRDHAHAVMFVTGHMKDGRLDLNWEAIVQPKQTIVFYMGLHGLETLCEQLIQHGFSSQQSAALVEKGTQPEQRVLTADLATLAARARDADMAPPALLIVGDVVQLHQRLGWYRAVSNETMGLD